VSLGKSRTATLIHGDFLGAAFGACFFFPNSFEASERASNRRAKRRSGGNGPAIAFVVVVILCLCLDVVSP
jgi:hypothetical protein